MTHLNFSVEQHGGIYISLSGNVSTFFLFLQHWKDTKETFIIHTEKKATRFLETNGEHLLLNTTVQHCSLFLIIEVIKYVCLVEPWSLFRAARQACYL